VVDAAGGKVGNAVDQVLLYCYQYDPKAGRYSASILNLVRLGAGLTVLGLVGFIFGSSLRRRRAPRRAGGPESGGQGLPQP
jgi:protein SCO1/2